MDDIMILMHKVVVDIQGFDDSQFGIFDDSEHEQLVYLWKKVALGNPNKFISMLSPEQKHRLGIWASDRTSFDVDDLIEALEKFTRFLKSASYAHHQTYPKPQKVSKKLQPRQKKKNIIFS